MKSRIAIFLLIAMALACHPTLVCAQCAMCKRSLETGGSAGLLEGFYWSIVLMLTVPAALIASITFLIVRAAEAQGRLIERTQNLEPNGDSIDCPQPPAPGPT